MAGTQRNRTTTDAIEIVHRRFFAGKPRMEAMLLEERANAEIAQMIYDLRTKANLSQRELAKLAGTTASVICRLEDADYEGHSLSMLQRIAAALGRGVQVKFVKPRHAPKPFSRKHASQPYAQL